MTAAVYVGKFEPGTTEWVEARRTGLGGSEIAAVLGLSPFESRFSLWHRKNGTAAPQVDNDLMEWGRRLEPVIAGKYADEHPQIVPVKTGMWSNVDRPWQLASPDRFIHPDILECKTAWDGLGWGEPGTDEIPVYYRAQALWYLDTLGLDVCHLAVLIAGSDYREYVLHAEPAEATLMRKAAQKFLATLTRGERPPIDGHDETYRLIRDQHPDIEPVDVDVHPDVAQPYLDAIGGHQAACAEKRRTTALLADAMGTARRAVYRGDVIATRIPGRNGGPPYVKAAASKEAGQKVSAA